MKMARTLMPERVQLRRTKGWRLPENTVKVDRSTKWGNPFVAGRDGTQAECVEAFGFLAGEEAGLQVLDRVLVPSAGLEAAEKMLAELWEIAPKLESRINTLEAILDDEVPDWRKKI